MTVINAIDCIRKQLLSEPTLTNLVDERIYHGDLKKVLQENVDVNYPLITFLYQGGDFPIRCIKEISDDNITFQIYSDESWEECHDVWDVLRDILYQQRVYDENVRVLFTQISNPVPLVDRTGNEDMWYLSIVYLLTIIEE